MSLGGRLVELPQALWALHVVGVLRRRRRWEIGQLAAGGEVLLNHPRLADGAEELLVLGTPVGLLHWHFFFVEALLDERLCLCALGSHLGCVEDLHFLGRRLLANVPMLLDSVLVETPAADVAALLVRTKGSGLRRWRFRHGCRTLKG